MKKIIFLIVCFGTFYCCSENEKQENKGRFESLENIKLQNSCCGNKNTPDWIYEEVYDFAFHSKGAYSSLWLNMSMFIYSIKKDGNEYFNIYGKYTTLNGEIFEDSNRYYTCTGEKIDSLSQLYINLTTQNKTLLWRYNEQNK